MQITIIRKNIYENKFRVIQDYFLLRPLRKIMIILKMTRRQARLSCINFCKIFQTVNENVDNFMSLFFILRTKIHMYTCINF